METTVEVESQEHWEVEMLRDGVVIGTVNGGGREVAERISKHLKGDTRVRHFRVTTKTTTTTEEL